MPLLKPDPTFYPSPTMAMQSPPEKLACLALINPLKEGRPDAIGVVDWINLDWLWAGALVITGSVVLLT